MFISFDICGMPTFWDSDPSSSPISSGPNEVHVGEKSKKLYWNYKKLEPDQIKMGLMCRNIAFFK